MNEFTSININLNTYLYIYIDRYIIYIYIFFFFFFGGGGFPACIGRHIFMSDLLHLSIYIDKGIYLY